MKEVAKYPGLALRGSKWELRVAVPKDLVETISKCEICNSFGTGSYAEARRRYHVGLNRICWSPISANIQILKAGGYPLF